MKEMDQSATTQAYVSGMRGSLGLHKNELVELTTYFSIGYALGLIPGQIIQTKAAFWPTVVALILNWYTPAELALRIACFNVSDVAGAMFLGAFQAALYRNMNGVHGIMGWQWLFIISGAITIGQGLLAFFTIPDSPSITRALWLTESEKRLARERMEEFSTTTSKLIPLAVLRRKLRQIVVHPVMYFFLVAFALNAWAHRANSYFVLYLESVEDAAGSRVYSTYQVNILPLGGYALQIVTSLVFNALSDWKHWRWQISIASAALYGICLAVLCGWPSNPHIVMAFYFLTYAANFGSSSLIAWMAELMRKNPEARSIIVVITVTIVYVGHATIPLRAFRVADAPRYPIGFSVVTAMTVGTIVVQLGMLWWVKRHGKVLELGFDGFTEESRRADEEIRETDAKKPNVDVKAS